MARARGANAQMALGFNTGAYGSTVVPGGYFRLPFVTSNLGEEQGLVDSDLLGFGRQPQEPGQDVINNEGDVVVPVDLRNFGFWLKMLFGQPVSDTQGVPATGSYTFTGQPANNAIITVGGQAFTFVSAAPAANQIQIGANLEETIQNAVIALNASAMAGVSVASYSMDLAGTQILIAYDTVGTGGNAMTIVAGTSPASNATVSGATLAGGATTGPYNHVFQDTVNLPDAVVEIGMPEVPHFGLNYGVKANTLAIALQRSGHLNATISLIAQGEQQNAATGAGTPTELPIKRFSQFSGQVERDGVALGDLVSGNVNFTNGLDKIETIRPDGRIAGADDGMVSCTGSSVIRFKDRKLLTLATNKTPVDLRFRWRISATEVLQMIVHRVFLPKVKVPITGPGGVQSTFNWQAAEGLTAAGAGLGKTVTVTLINDVATY